MSQPGPDSALYRLIEAGQLAHQALLVPLLSRGLEVGDDAVLLVLGSSAGMPLDELAAKTGVAPEAIEARIERLVDRDLIARRAVEPELVPGIALTERGERIQAVLAGNWQELEEALFGELKKKERRRLTRALKRFGELLRL